MIKKVDGEISDSLHVSHLDSFYEFFNYDYSFMKRFYDIDNKETKLQLYRGYIPLVNEQINLINKWTNIAKHMAKST
jgi:hypothetical protein